MEMIKIILARIPDPKKNADAAYPGRRRFPDQAVDVGVGIVHHPLEEPDPADVILFVSL